MGHDDSIDALAATQHGVVARHQLLAAAVPVHAVDHRIVRGRLLSLHPGVYAVRGHPATFEHRLTAACLAAGPGAAASHRGAAALHQLAGVDPRLEVAVAVARAPRLNDVAVHRAADLDRRAVEVRDGIPRTTIARTLVDLAAVVPATRLEQALDDALGRRLVTSARVEASLERLGRQGRKGAGALARLLAERRGEAHPVESRFERRLLAILVSAGLPLPIPQFEVTLPKRRRARLDLAYPDHLLALEADSYRHHSSRTDWARDHTRNRLLTALGWRIIPVTWEDLSDPAALAALVARGLHGFQQIVG